MSKIWNDFNDYTPENFLFRLIVCCLGFVHFSYLYEKDYHYGVHAAACIIFLIIWESFAFWRHEISKARQEDEKAKRKYSDYLDEYKKKH